MKRLPWIALSLVMLCAGTVMAQNSNSSTSSNTNAATANANKKKRGPVFRATSEQIKQAQAILKRRSFYAGEETGKLSTETRAGLKLYQAAEGLKATGTLNKVTLEKMGIVLTDKQKAM
jgi:peptidoglycan hydrolase-like protein with peptidoglycan-binding domain